MVYGGKFSVEPIAHESPDFFIEGEKDFILGVEVTESFSNQTEAKLRKLDNYSDDLLDGRQNIHLKDKGSISVDDITLIDENDEEIATTKAIIHKLPTIRKRLEGLQETIGLKNKKVKKYLSVCSEVDLIIKDSSNLFIMDDFDSFFKKLYFSIDLTVIKESLFREIFLLVSLKGKAEQIVPLKISFLLSDLYAFDSLLSDDPVGSSCSEDHYSEVIQCALSLSRHNNLKVKISDIGYSFANGGWEYLHEKDETFLRDRTSVLEKPEEGYVPIESIKNFDPLTFNIAKKLQEKRASIHAVLPVCLNSNGD